MDALLDAMQQQCEDVENKWGFLNFESGKEVAWEQALLQGEVDFWVSELKMKEKQFLGLVVKR